ncbi:hypothetical protein SAY86_011098 [Trapa natans]|uniref:Pentatricopeptide repeat-containing protein n=1 Tax=Trapa natans TaxID=22666 RepID=A0AAN7R3X0_TRANT|nr:hypothetical protein SAY86_011098 [Trapa natans]
MLNTNPTGIFNQVISETGGNDAGRALIELEVLDRMRREGDVSLALHFFMSVSNSMIKKLARGQETDGIQYLLQQTKLEGLSCNEVLFIDVIGSYWRAGLVEQALKVFYRIREFGCALDVKIYNHLLDALLCEKKF